MNKRNWWFHGHDPDCCTSVFPWPHVLWYTAGWPNRPHLQVSKSTHTHRLSHTHLEIIQWDHAVKLRSETCVWLPRWLCQEFVYTAMSDLRLGMRQWHATSDSLNTGMGWSNDELVRFHFFLFSTMLQNWDTHIYCKV